jgi:hypothetical protein
VLAKKMVIHQEGSKKMDERGERRSDTGGVEMVFPVKCEDGRDFTHEIVRFKFKI